MLPARTFSPPNFFTPRRRPALSRPLREEPPAFLCAMALSSTLPILQAWLFAFAGALSRRGLLRRCLLRRLGRLGLRLGGFLLRLGLGRRVDLALGALGLQRGFLSDRSVGLRLLRRGLLLGLLVADRGDAKDRVLLAVAPLAAVIVAAA